MAILPERPGWYELDENPNGPTLLIAYVGNVGNVGNAYSITYQNSFWLSEFDAV